MSLLSGKIFEYWDKAHCGEQFIAPPLMAG